MCGSTRLTEFLQSSDSVQAALLILDFQFNLTLSVRDKADKDANWGGRKQTLALSELFHTLNGYVIVRLKGGSSYYPGGLLVELLTGIASAGNVTDVLEYAILLTVDRIQ